MDLPSIQCTAVTLNRKRFLLSLLAGKLFHCISFDKRNLIRITSWKQYYREMRFGTVVTHQALPAQSAITNHESVLSIFVISMLSIKLTHLKIMLTLAIVFINLHLFAKDET